MTPLEPVWFKHQNPDLRFYWIRKIAHKAHALADAAGFDELEIWDVDET